MLVQTRRLYYVIVDLNMMFVLFEHEACGDEGSGLMLIFRVVEGAPSVQSNNSRCCVRGGNVLVPFQGLIVTWYVRDWMKMNEKSPDRIMASRGLLLRLPASSAHVMKQTTQTSAYAQTSSAYPPADGVALEDTRSVGLRH